MHDYTRIVIHFIALTSILFIQLSVWQHWQYITPHVLFILYIQSLYNDHSYIKLSYLAFLCEIISFIQTGFTGLTLVLLLPLSILLKKIKKYFNFQIIASCLIITIFCILYALFLNLGAHITIQINTLIPQIIINCILYWLISLIKIKKKSYTK